MSQTSSPILSGRSLALGAGLVVVALLPLAAGASPYMLGLLISALILAGLALSWALLGNLGGMVSFGHAAFFGVGSYASALLAARLGVPVLLAIPLAGLIATISSLAMLPALRLSGPYFALAILAYAQIFRILATEATWLTGGAAGLQRYPGLPTLFGFNLAERHGSYVLVLAMVVICAIIYVAIRRSHVGIALRAIAESEDATRVVGVNSTLLKTWMLMLSAFIAGMFGALNAHIIGFLEPDYAFSGIWSVMPIIAAVFGGYRTVLGPVLGAIVIYMFDQVVAKSLIPVGHQILLGILLAIMVLVAPNGLAGLLSRFFSRSGGKHHARA
ncbi:ABC-type branched-chain amino acid transport permease component [Azorhizobium caulinodans ORS 571]|uniref:ABC-type branched-chain amino acid transport permease component n=1 Tax=Azorhizobium caulinodans (strain ATCC 43989 / DSM 5975 / JCM 20966 / LMG 6465 / NBRC 14845 / NCIMB 13405 / ORS 571) TaxID=438753 RepID=A8ID14_AZOC5|nr:branched-chain amino acid ABC transporter permease [Azorhizobium caulinodans]BAF88868.1 ABC-type branched-chain amino acid transport permease component [Azorhizobium caulinodans ORS 571]